MQEQAYLKNELRELKLRVSAYQLLLKDLATVLAQRGWTVHQIKQALDELELVKAGHAQDQGSQSQPG